MRHDSFATLKNKFGEDYAIGYYRFLVDVKKNKEDEKTSLYSFLSLLFQDENITDDWIERNKEIDVLRGFFEAKNGIFTS